MLNRIDNKQELTIHNLPFFIRYTPYLSDIGISTTYPYRFIILSTLLSLSVPYHFFVLLLYFPL